MFVGVAVGAQESKDSATVGVGKGQPPCSFPGRQQPDLVSARQAGGCAVPHHLAVLTDFPGEGWPSMDLCGDMLLAHLPREGPLAVKAALLCPPVPPAGNPATGGHNTRDPIRAGLGGGRASGRPPLRASRGSPPQRSRSSPSRPKAGLPWAPGERNFIMTSSRLNGPSRGSAIQDAGLPGHVPQLFRRSLRYLGRDEWPVH